MKLQSALLWVLSFGFFLTGCPTRFISDDSGTDMSPGGASGTAGTAGTKGTGGSGPTGGAGAGAGTGGPATGGAAGMNRGGSGGTAGQTVSMTGGSGGQTGQTGGQTGQTGGQTGQTGGSPGTGGVSTGGSGTGGSHSGGAGGHSGSGGIGGASGTVGSTGGRSGAGGSATGGASGASGSGGSCPVGQTNCGGTCTDLTSDDHHCGACTGQNADCTISGQTVKHCRASQCRLADGYTCSSDADCASAKCDTFYADSDQDGYPDKLNTARFCTFPGSTSANGPATTYIAPRSDVMWDCCDQLSTVHPGATQFVAWNASSTFDAECMASAGDTNCDGTVEVQTGAVITTACTVQGDGSCDVATRTPTSADCGQAICGCGAPAPNSSCVLYCPPTNTLGCR